MFKKFIVYLCIWCLFSTGILSTFTLANIDDQSIDETIEVLFSSNNGRNINTCSIEMTIEDFANFWGGVDEFQKSLKDEKTYNGPSGIIEKFLLGMQNLQDTYITKERFSKDNSDHFSFLSNVEFLNKTIAKHHLSFVSVTGTISKCSIGSPLFVFLSLASIFYLFAYLFQFPVVEKCLFPFLIPAIFVVPPRLFFGFLLDRFFYTNTPLKRSYIPIAAIWSENKDLDVNIHSGFQQYNYNEVGSLLLRNFVGLWITVPVLKQSKIIGFTGYTGVDTLELNLTKLT
ncbi:MAG: hypothetical protein JXA91_03475 [Candidatus Thermoplasmatota archaeon]|nr:hypothetical protein [Candidatus Thermoplasmatota archaeon]